MTGRGVDQALAHPVDPRLWEAYVWDARDYLRLVEAVSGPVPTPVEPGWLWGEALSWLTRTRPAAFVINVETSITRRDDAVPGKAVHYRMAPENLAALTVAHPDVAVLANNHVADFGPDGLLDTLRALEAAGIATAGAGADADRAARPAVVPLEAGGRVLVFGLGDGSSGIPPAWAATTHRPGVALLPDLSPRTATEVGERIQAARRPGDVAVVSIHWGTNWGYRVPAAQVAFAHRLIDTGVDLVHGHSSHHPRPIEVYRDRLILYGCGDFIDDYEGIGGHAGYRDELRLLYLAALADTGALLGLTMVPLRAERLRLRFAPPADRRWLCDSLDEVSRRFGTRVTLDPEGTLSLRV